MVPMATHYKFKVIFWISFIVFFIQNQNEVHASHAQSADITYKCIGGNQYEISLSFYRDCAGVAAPGSVSINLSSVSCNQNFNAVLNPINGTGLDITPVCNTQQTQCQGGSVPGVQEFIYRGNVTLPQKCSDWVFSFTLCCRNASITTIVNPSAENIYVQATLDNLNFTCNNSPSFSNAPIPFICVGQNFCFNHGATDIDGDSLTYTLVAPGTSPNTTVTYINPFSPTQPLYSSPPVTFNSQTGDICMTSTQIQVTVLAVLVREFRNGVLIGSVVRDLQFRTMSCTNNIPYINGINGTGNYSLAVCAGTPISFFTNSFDADASQTVTLTWNNGINGATFTVSGGAKPTGTFNWTPTVNDISTAPHCFTITVTDDNCPYKGSQTYAFCITVSGVGLVVASSNANCGASNGTASVTASKGISPYTYSWSNGGNNSTTNGLQSGTYTVTVTDKTGCSTTATVFVGPGGLPSTVQTSVVNVSCFGGTNGVATANVNGGQQPYTYQWSNGGVTSGISSLVAGTYTVLITTANGCTTTAGIIVTQPSSALSLLQSQTNVSCNGGNNGSASIIVSGGTTGYTYLWSNGQSSSTSNGLIAGTYTATVNDANGCTVTATYSIVQPQVLSSNVLVVNNVSCSAGANGLAIVSVSGGTGFYTYSWSNAQNTQTASGLSAGNYTVTVTDANGCTSTSTVIITQPTLISMYYTQNNVSCNGANNGSATFSPSGGNGAYTYSWSTGANGSSVNNLGAGTYSLTVTDAKGCTATQQVIITQPAVLTATFTTTNVSCSGGNNGMASITVNGGTSGYTFAWSNGSTSQQVNTLLAGNYTVSITDARGCSTNVTFNISQPSQLSVVTTKPPSLCAGQNLNLTATVSGGTSNYSYLWQPGGFTTSTINVAPSVSTNYTVTVTDQCNIVATSVASMNIYPLPVVSLSPQSGSGCDRVAFQFANNSNNGSGNKYSWSFGDGASSSLVSPVHGYDKNGVYTVTLTVTSSQGCVNTATTTCSVAVSTSPVADFITPEEPVTIIFPVVHFKNTSANSTSWSWDFGDKTTSNQASPVHTYKAKGLYTVTLRAYNQSVCTDSMVKTVEILPEFTIYIPNAFTPNGDGKNDIFTGKGEEIDTFEMMIFDRWGELIYSTDDIHKGWDGRAKDGNLVSQMGVYVYKVLVKDTRNKRHNFVGSVSLIL